MYLIFKHLNFAFCGWKLENISNIHREAFNNGEAVLNSSGIKQTYGMISEERMW